MISVCSTFKETTKLFSKGVVPFASLQHLRAPFLCIFASTWYGFFHHSCPSGCEVLSHCDFASQSPPLPSICLLLLKVSWRLSRSCLPNLSQPQLGVMGDRTQGSFVDRRDGQMRVLSPTSFSAHERGVWPLLLIFSSEEKLSQPVLFLLLFWYKSYQAFRKSRDWCSEHLSLDVRC